MSSYAEWRIAYAKQAKADLQARERLLEHADLPDCQQLHFLQMACEKICKAYLCGQGIDLRALQSSHAYVAISLPLIARQQFARQSQQIQASRSWVIAAIRVLARKIELLAPAVRDGGAQPSNCEYPWESATGTVIAPVDHNFQLNLLYEAAGRHLIKVLYTACDDLMREEQDVARA
ncbi:MAG: hypothetical protein ABIP55_02045 [Tepidisphaeraceae bacterium]